MGIADVADVGAAASAMIQHLGAPPIPVEMEFLRKALPPGAEIEHSWKRPSGRDLVFVGEGTVVLSE